MEPVGAEQVAKRRLAKLNSMLFELQSQMVSVQWHERQDKQAEMAALEELVASEREMLRNAVLKRLQEELHMAQRKVLDAPKAERSHLKKVLIHCLP